MMHSTQTHPCRIIPARAGFTALTCTIRGRIVDHPRSRGVYVRDWVREGEEGGSSPLARGLPRERGLIRAQGWFIPARAGFTKTHDAQHRKCLDHPRSRGVYDHPHGSVGPLMGSSPLARGLRRVSGSGRCSVGIIPARAGFTIQTTQLGKVDADHPRSRGVYAALGPVQRRFAGSSPLARGLLPAARPRF